GIPALGEISLMLVTSEWIPIEDSSDLLLVERLIREDRSFVKALRYNLPLATAMATATLLDTPHPCPLCIERGPTSHVEHMAHHGRSHPQADPQWSWSVAGGQMPAFPERH